MGELKGYRCPNCGSMIPVSSAKTRGLDKIYKCDACDSEYEKIDDYLKPLKVEVCEAKLVTLAVKREVPQEYLRDEESREKVIEHTLKGISHELAESIIPFIEVETYMNPERMTTVIGGRVKVVDRR